MSTNDTPLADGNRSPTVPLVGPTARSGLKPKIAETSRQERQQGGEPQLGSSGDGAVNAAGPHDKPELATKATEGSGMLPTPGEAADDDMAPGG